MSAEPVSAVTVVCHGTASLVAGGSTAIWVDAGRVHFVVRAEGGRASPRLGLSPALARALAQAFVAAADEAEGK